MDVEDDVTDTSLLAMPSLSTTNTRTTTTSLSDDNNDNNNEDSITSDSQGGVVVLPRRTRKSSRQASEARLDEKEARDSLKQRYCMAFKEAIFCCRQYAAK